MVACVLRSEGFGNMFRKAVITFASCLILAGCAGVSVPKEADTSTNGVLKTIVRHDLHKQITQTSPDGTENEVTKDERWREIDDESEAYKEYRDVLTELGYEKGDILCKYTRFENKWVPASDASYEIGYVPLILIDEVNDSGKYMSCTEVNLLPGAQDKMEYVSSIIKDGKKVTLDYSEIESSNVLKVLESDFDGTTAKGSYLVK